MKKIYSPGEKVKNIRKSLNLKQADIIDDTVTRNLISLIENNKVKLSKKTAEIIVKKINESYKKNNINKTVNIDYLLESKSSQAQKKLVKIIKHFTSQKYDLDEKLFKIDYLTSIIESSKEKSDILENIGDILLEDKFYLKAYTYYIKSLENLTSIGDIKDLSCLYYKLGKISVELEKYNEGIFFNKLGISLLENKNEVDYNLIIRLLYNLSLGYKNINKYDKALETLNKTTNYEKFANTKEIISISILKGNLFTIKKNYDEALNYYKKCVKLAKNENLDGFLALTYINFSAVYTKMEDYKKALEYILLALPLQKTTNKKDVPLIYHDIGELYIKSEKYKLAKENLLKPILSSEYNIEDELLMKIYIQLLRVYIANNEFKDIYAIISLVESKFKLNSDISCNLKLKVEHFYLIAIEYLFDKDQLTTKRLIDNLKGGKENDKN